MFSKRRPDAEFDREIAFHIEQLTQDGIAQGLTPAEASRRAILEFGGREQVTQKMREVHTSALVESIAFNLRAAMRFLRRSPSFAAAVILTLGLGIGANSAVFSAIDAVILRPLPYPAGDQLVALTQQDATHRNPNTFVAPIRLEDWNRMSSAFQGISGYYLDDLSETSGSLPEKVTEALVAPRFLQVLQVSPILGRNFVSQEEHFGGPNAALISYGFWQRRFHGDPNAIGKKLHIGAYSYSIVGVMPQTFAFPNREVEIWTPSPPDAPYAQSRISTWFKVIGRLKPGLTLHQGQADLATVQSRLGKQFPNPDADLIVVSTPLKATVVGDSGGSLWMLYGAVSLLLLIACSNIAALLLARTAGREHEISVRFALGASRRTIIAQLLTEVFVLALLGSLAGIAIAAGAAHGFHLMAKTLPRASEIKTNWTIALYSLLCAVATTLFCGLVPAMRGTRRQLAHSLAQNSRTQASTRSPIQWILVGIQVTLAVTLLTGAGLLIRSLQNLKAVAPGFDASHILTFQLTGSWSETTDMASMNRRIDRNLDSLRTIPGVEDAATAGFLPGLPSLYQVQFALDGNLDPNRTIQGDVRTVSQGYFPAMNIPLLRGRACREGSPTKDVVVNRSFAAMYLGDSEAIGHALSQADNAVTGLTGQIVGVVGDAREEGLNTLPMPTVYDCVTAGGPFPYYIVRTHGDPSLMAESIRQRLQQLEPSRSAYGIAPLQEKIDDVSSEPRLRTLLLTFFAGSAVSLACIGLYGTLNYLGRMRQREVGVRLALGALRGQIVMRFLLQGLRVSLAGCIAGLALSVAGGRLLAGMLYGVSPIDPATWLAVAALILLVATLASLFPAWRAARVEPVQVLRQE
ncbi:MAG TPA: ABC transporter permease [Acidobacteriaceae bacterium]|nr:ABC transporter permease [Acidobacteriaceae bacterium]